MPTLSAKPRVAQLAVVAVIALISLGIAMCSGHSDNNSGSAKRSVTATPPASQPSAAPPPAPPPPPEAKDYVEGMVESVSGTTIALRTRTGSATVGFGPATRVVDVTPAKLSDVTPGSCVNVRGAPQSAPSGGAITAQTVTITAAADGKCPPPAGFYGTVASVSGDTISVNGMGPAPTAVTVANTTTYQRQTPTDAQVITNGKCMGAQGTNAGGALQAVMISLEACPPMGHHHHHLHLPHLPFHL